MSSKLTIDFKWLGWPTDDPLDRALSADLGLRVGGEWLTLLEDREASTVRNHLRSSAYYLAVWFAANWWRLRWEPEMNRWAQDTDWRIAHNLASAGGGYVWPNVCFASDGNLFRVSSRPQAEPPTYEPVRYLNRVEAAVQAVDFESEVDAFLASVLSRLDALKVADDTLPSLWAEVQAERHDPEATQHRKLEAMAGFDPDDAPEGLLTQFARDAARLGKGSVEEVVAQGRADAGEVLKWVRQLPKSKPAADLGGFRGSLPGLDTTPLPAHQNEQPWEAAKRLARTAREQWSLGRKKPIPNKALGDLVGVGPDVFRGSSTERAPLPLALRTGSQGKFDVYFHSHNVTSRRFSLSRLIGDRLHSASGEKLLPATEAKTSRQKFQRAFAQEFLCPIDALLEKIQTEYPGQDDIEEAALHFYVSPLMVRTTLVNHHELGREALAWVN